MPQRVVANIMTPHTECIPPNTSVSAVVGVMAKEQRSCVVVGDGRRPEGIVTERDIVRLIARSPNSFQDVSVSDIMSSPAVSVDMQSSILHALQLSRARRLRHLVIVDEVGLLVGIVTQTDMVDSYLSTLQNYETNLADEVKSRTEQLEESNRQLLDLAMEDGLLKIGNRRAMEIDLNHTQSTANRYGEEYHLALLDIDFFKRYNDEYGHQRGDEALRRVVEIIQTQIRDSDRLYRYGGEEFVLLMPKVDLQSAKEIAERSRAAIEKAAIEHNASPYTVLTISAGVAEGNCDDWRKSVEDADRRLYRAKHNGRNRVITKDECIDENTDDSACIKNASQKDGAN
ncbi:diguanylate cyclase [Aurantivibrio plasticivorans]